MTDLERLKADILANTFMDQLRGRHTIDMDAFNRLHSSMEVLATTWKGSAKVDKELMSALYELVSMTMYQSLSASWEERERKEIWNLYTTLDRLFTECLS